MNEIDAMKKWNKDHKIIDAELLQKKRAMPRYQIREVPIREPENPKQKRIVEEIARIQREHGLIRREP